MKKYISILFLAITMLCTNSQFLELAKLPVLIEHFNEHKQWDSKVSFVGFMYMHYLQEFNKYGDYARDMEMPFKTSSQSFTSVIGFIVPSPDYLIITKTTHQNTEQKQITNSSVYSAQYLSAIWQPPKAS